MAKQTKVIARFALVGTLLALLVIGLGAYTRLSDAGLGCPDWPGCYGHVTVPQSSHEIARAEKAYPQTPVVAHKAWKEMIHRYLAGSLGLVIVALAVLSLRHRREDDHSIALPISLVGLLIYQAMLGMWTVTWQLLPLVVMGHLLGGMLIVSLLWLTRLKAQGYTRLAPSSPLKRYRPWAVLAVIVVFFQIALGGWTSSNYAALTCPDFPMCHGQWLPALDFKDAFNFAAPIGHNYEGGLLDTMARTTIQITHRLGALITVLFVGGFALLQARSTVSSIRNAARVVLGLLVVQASLGILNVLWALPVVVAVGHNLVAALLLLSTLTLAYFFFMGAESSSSTDELIHG